MSAAARGNTEPDEKNIMDDGDWQTNPQTRQPSAFGLAPKQRQQSSSWQLLSTRRRRHMYLIFVVYVETTTYLSHLCCRTHVKHEVRLLDQTKQAKNAQLSNTNKTYIHMTKYMHIIYTYLSGHTLRITILVNTFVMINFHCELSL